MSGNLGGYSLSTKLTKEIEFLLDQLKQEQGTKLKVALFGQPGAGKSSLVNALTGQKLAKVGVETDCTITGQDYEHHGIVFTDLPGYNTKKFPENQYLKAFDILSYDVFLCVTNNKLHGADSRLFKVLQKHNKVCLFVEFICG